MQDKDHNIEIQSMYEAMQSESVPIDSWPKWIISHLGRKL